MKKLAPGSPLNMVGRTGGHFWQPCPFPLPSRAILPGKKSMEGNE